ncbi:hypothetical protein F4777DRAFT_534235 [Nemania sp. FL0916]|nr:hypothetical protein F4777DRAFT_534235 [Nemania sp. FL0916]
MFLSALFRGSSRRSGHSRNANSKSQTQIAEPSPSSTQSPPLSPSPSLPSPSASPAPSIQSQSRPQSRTGSRSDYIVDEAQLEPVTPPPDDIVSLNGDLATLSSLFPDIQVEVFREMLSTFSDESKLFVITDMLLKNSSAYVKGRRRIAQTGQETAVPAAEAFRTPAYKTAVRALALQEFKGLSRSSIDAVLSESNYSYLAARPTLVDLSSKSWKFVISSLVFRRKPVTSSEADTHPLVSWKTAEGGSLVPAMKPTGNAELDRELFEQLVVPVQARERAAREEADHAFAVSLQTEEAEACEATYECACCYTDNVFEQMTTCSAEGHMICFRCVQHSITEAVFGQGWQRTIHKETGALRCPAVSSSECEGCVSHEHIQRAMHGTEKGAEIIGKLEQRLAEHDLLASGIPLIRCPFCSYAEVDELYIPDGAPSPRVHLSGNSNVFLLFAVVTLSFAPFLLFLLISFCLTLSLSAPCRRLVSQQFAAAVNRCQRRRRGLKFVCQNPACGRASCMSCSKAWIDIHVCHESSLIALRTQVEQAMSMAIKRVCPRCNTSFVKEIGCNKLTCPCGYKMCYVCRKDISVDGYQHFCQHFRPEGDGKQCRECNKCNLWEVENTDAILRKAKADAERRWKEREQRELSDAEKAYLESGVGGMNFSNRNGLLGLLFSSRRPPTLEDMGDFIVDQLIV